MTFDYGDPTLAPPLGWPSNVAWAAHREVLAHARAGSFEQQVETALHHLFDLFGLPPQAVVDHARIDEVVRSHLVAAAAVTELGFAFGRVFRSCDGSPLLVDFGGEHTQGIPTVALLVTAVDEHPDTSRAVNHAHSRIRLVLVLPPGAAAALRLDVDLLRIEGFVGDFVWQG